MWVVIALCFLMWCIVEKTRRRASWSVVVQKFKNIVKRAEWIPQGDYRYCIAWFDIAHYCASILLGLLLYLTGLPVGWILPVGLFLYFICWEGIGECGWHDHVFKWEWGDLISDSLGFLTSILVILLLSHQ